MRWQVLGYNAASINVKKVILKKKLFFENCYKGSAINGLETRYGSGTGTVKSQNRNRKK